MENKSENIQVRMPPGLAQKVREQAAREERKVTEWLREVVRRELERATAIRASSG